MTDRVARRQNQPLLNQVQRHWHRLPVSQSGLQHSKGKYRFICIAGKHVFFRFRVLPEFPVFTMSTCQRTWLLTNTGDRIPDSCMGPPKNGLVCFHLPCPKKVYFLFSHASSWKQIPQGVIMFQWLSVRRGGGTLGVVVQFRLENGIQLMNRLTSEIHFPRQLFVGWAQRKWKFLSLFLINCGKGLLFRIIFVYFLQMNHWLKWSIGVLLVAACCLGRWCSFNNETLQK